MPGNDTYDTRAPLEADDRVDAFTLRAFARGHTTAHFQRRSREREGFWLRKWKSHADKRSTRIEQHRRTSR